MVKMAKNEPKVRNIGIPNVEPPEKVCNDLNCPFHGTLSVRGRILEGTVTSVKMHKAITFQTDFLSLVKKYLRYERRRSKKHAYLPPCIEVNVGDTVKVVECRPISKTISFTVVSVTPSGVVKED